MRAFGIFIAVGGVSGLIFALIMDTSVSTGFGSVNNIGLMADRQNYMIASGVAIIVGVLFALFAPKDEQLIPASGMNTSVRGFTVADRACPECAEMIKPEARKCRFCGSEVVPLATKCEWCSQSAPAPNQPCSALSVDKLLSSKPDIKNRICTAEIDRRHAKSTSVEGWDQQLPPVQH